MWGGEEIFFCLCVCVSVCLSSKSVCVSTPTVPSCAWDLGSDPTKSGNFLSHGIWDPIRRSRVVCSDEVVVNILHYIINNEPMGFGIRSDEVGVSTKSGCRRPDGRKLINHSCCRAPLIYRGSKIVIIVTSIQKCTDHPD